MNHKKCSYSTGIHGGITVGQGMIDPNGYFDRPCYYCARKYEKEHPGEKVCPFAETFLGVDKAMIRKRILQFIVLLIIGTIFFFLVDYLADKRAEKELERVSVEQWEERLGVRPFHLYQDLKTVEEEREDRESYQAVYEALAEQNRLKREAYIKSVQEECNQLSKDLSEIFEEERKEINAVGREKEKNDE